MEVLSTIFYIIIAILVLMLMITIHELGHYLAGKALGFKIKQFSIGFGKALFQRTSKKTGEKFAIRIFPLGGFCEFEGEDEAGNESPQAFNNQKPWKRVIVLLAGAFSNFVVSVLIIILVFSIGGMYFPSVAKNYKQSDRDLNGALIPLEDMVAVENSRLQQGDIILQAGGEFLYLNGDLNKALSKFDIGEDIPITVVRNGKQIDLNNVKKAYFFQPDYGKINKNTFLYEEKDTSSGRLYPLKDKQQAEILEKGESFWHVRITAEGKDYFGYVEAADIVHVYSATINSSEAVPLYKSKDSSEQLVMLPSAQQVEVLEKGNDFWHIEVTLNNKEYQGYVEAGSITDAYIGLGIGQGAATYRLPFFEMLGKSFVYSIKIAWAILSAFWQIITGQIGLGNIGGMTATVDITAQIARSGFRNLVDIVAMIGINLAIFNVLPLPALDGGRVVFVGIEWIRKKPIKREIEAKIHMWGIIILLGLIVVFDVSYWIIKLIN